MSSIPSLQPAPAMAACDPNNVQETFVNGPISIQGVGTAVTLTFTTIRAGDIADAMRGGKIDRLSAVVVSRLAMPQEIAVQLRDLLNNTLQMQTGPSGSVTKQ